MISVNPESRTAMVIARTVVAIGSGVEPRSRLHAFCKPSLQSARRRPWPRERAWKRNVALLAIVAMVNALGVIATVATPVRAAEPIAAVPLGLVETFGILTSAAVGNATPEPATVIRGDVGGGGAITGFPPGIVTGTVYAGADVDLMMVDLHVAYDDAAGRPAGTPLPAVLSGSYGPGIHTSSAASGTAAEGSFAIDGEGDPASVFIFQINGALALGANTTMNLINGARAENVFWQVVGAGRSSGPAASVRGTSSSGR